jgi:hypothetical protein
MNIKIDLNVCRVCLKQPLTSVRLFDDLRLYLKLQDATGLSVRKK